MSAWLMSPSSAAVAVSPACRIARFQGYFALMNILWRCAAYSRRKVPRAVFLCGL